MAARGLENWKGIPGLTQNMLGEYLIWPASTLESSGNIWKVSLAKRACAAPSLVCHQCNSTLEKQKKQRKEHKRKQVTKRLKKRRKWTKEEKHKRRNNKVVKEGKENLTS